MKKPEKTSMYMTIAIFLAMAFAFVSPMEAGGATQNMQVAQVDVLANRISEAREAVRNNTEKKNEKNEFIALGKALYLGGAQRPDKPWLNDSFSVWEELLVRYPQEPLVQAYAGSVRVLKARDAFFPWTKGKLLKQGQELLVAARSQSPGNMQVIWLQAITAYHLPERFKQRDSAMENFAILANALEAFEMLKTDAEEQVAGDHNPAGDEKTIAMIDNLEPAMKASVWYYRGLGLEKKSDLVAAMAAWRHSVNAEPKSTAAKAAASCLIKHSAE